MSPRSLAALLHLSKRECSGKHLRWSKYSMAKAPPAKRDFVDTLSSQVFRVNGGALSQGEWKREGHINWTKRGLSREQCIVYIHIHTRYFYSSLFNNDWSRRTMLRWLTVKEDMFAKMPTGRVNRIYTNPPPPFDLGQCNSLSRQVVKWSTQFFQLVVIKDSECVRMSALLKRF